MPKRQPNTCTSFGHDLRVDLDASAIADHHDAAARRDDRQVVIELTLASISRITSGRAAEAHDLSRQPGALWLTVLAPCAFDNRDALVRSRRADHRAPAATANRVAATPTPPLAPWINTVSPARCWRDRRAPCRHVGHEQLAPCGTKRDPAADATDRAGTRRAARMRPGFAAGR